MERNKYTIMGALKSKFSFVLLLALIGITNAFAENTLKIDPFTIQPGSEKQVAVNLDNSDAIVGLQMQIVFPQGLTCTAVTRNNDRSTRTNQGLQFQQNSDSDTLSIVLTPKSTFLPFVGNSGAIVYLTIKADKSFNKKGTIIITGAAGSTADAKDLSIADFSTSVSPLVAKLALSESSLSIKPDSTVRTVKVGVNNDIDIYGLQADITLPKGMAIDSVISNSTVLYKFDYCDRLPESYDISSNKLSEGKYRIVISTLDTQPITGKSGALFTFDVKADKSLTEKSNIIIDNVKVSNATGSSFDLNDATTLQVTNTYLAQYVPVKAKFDALKVAYEAAVTKIAKDYADVVKDSAIVAQGNKIGSLISAAQTAIEGSYGKDNLANDSASILSNIKQAQTAVDKWVTDAAAAEKVFVDTKANKEANEAANTKLTAAITAVQAKMDAAKTTIATDCKDVVDQFVSVEKTIQTKIDSIKTSVKALYDAVKLTAESTVDTVAINTAIANMVTDATAAEKAFVDAKAKKEANEAANTKLTAAIAAVQAKLDAAKTTITTDCPAVVNHYVPVISDIIQEHINLKTDSVKAKYDAVELTAESTVDLTSIEIAIAQMVTDAKAEQKSISTGIYGIISTDPNVQIFSISGQKLTVPVKGAINIIKFSNGQTKKIFVK